MEITAQRIDGANAKITAVIVKETIDNNVEKIAKSLMKTAKIAGFRKGKVPVAVIKKTYGERLVQDAEAEALRELLAFGLKELEIVNNQLIGEPQISRFQKNGGTIDVEVTLAVRPTIDLGDYLSLVPEFEKDQATDEEINERIQELAQAQSPFVKVEEDRGLQNGDMAIIDFKGFVEGEELKGGSAENFSLSIGSGQFIPGFEDALLGTKVNEEKSIEMTFPENYQNKDIAGKPARFDVKLHEIQVKAPVEINDETAKKIMANDESATLETLKEKVKNDIENEKLSKRFNEELKPTMIEKFLEAIHFDLPAFVVNQEIDIAVNKRARTMSEEEIKAIQADANKLQALREEEKVEAEKSVKATFIVDALALKEGISVSEEELNQTIYYEAMMMGQDPQQTYDYYKNSGYLPAIQMAMVEDRVLSKLLDTKLKSN